MQYSCNIHDCNIMDQIKNDASSTDLKDYPYQVAGHWDQDPLRLTSDGACVLKPVQRPPKGEREVVFYETIFNKDEERDEILQLRRLLPHYYGIVELNSSRYLKLENITSKFVQPCIMDIKIGKVTWDDDADETFKERRKNEWPLREVTGFSILGYMIYNHKTCAYKQYRRDWCRNLTSVGDVEKTFQDFLGCVEKNLRQRTLDQLIEKLADILRWFRAQRLYKFIASSILIVYEADIQMTTNPTASAEQREQAFNGQLSLQPHCQSLSQVKTTLVEARIIDTAHVFLSPDVDSNYLFGLENVISMFEKIRTNLQRE